jgi:hypothetical protein
MNSLSDLNGYANDVILIPNDFRPAYFGHTSSNQSATCYENRTFVSPSGCTITKLININPFSLTINVAAVANTTVTWGNITSFTGNIMPVTNIDSLYTISGVVTQSDWDLVKNPVIDMGDNPPNNWSYDSTISYNDTYGGSGNISWITGVTVTQMDQLSTPSDYYFQPNISNIMLNTPKVVDLGLSDINNLNVAAILTPSNPGAISALSAATALGGTQSFSPGPNILTMMGNLEQVNSMLGNITYTPTTNSETTWLADYSLLNYSSNFTSHVTQYVRSEGTHYLTYTTPFYYEEDATMVITGAPNITDETGVGNTYIITLTTLIPNVLTTVSSTGSGGTASYNSGTQTFTIAGTKDQVNSHLNSLYIRTVQDYNSTITFVYDLSVSTGATASRVHTAYYSATTNTISFMNTSRTYIGNTPDQAIFLSPANTVPQISEAISGASYTIYLSTSAGKFGLSLDDYTANYSYTGTKEQVNALIPTLKFWPTKDVSYTQTFTYSQYINGILEFQQIVALTGSDPVITGAGTFTLYESTTFTPSYAQVHYLNHIIFSVGGGGGGGGNGIIKYAGGGGAGAGSYYKATWNSTGLPLADGVPVQVTIGAGGVGGSPSSLGNGGDGTSTVITVGNVTVTYPGGRGGKGNSISNPDGSGTAGGGVGLNGGGAGTAFAGGGGASISGTGGSAVDVNGGVGRAGAYYPQGSTGYPGTIELGAGGSGGSMSGLAGSVSNTGGKGATGSANASHPTAGKGGGGGGAYTGLPSAGADGSVLFYFY